MSGSEVVALVFFGPIIIGWWIMVISFAIRGAKGILRS